MSRKGQIIGFMPLLAIFVLIILSFALYSFLVKSPDKDIGIIGDVQGSLIKDDTLLDTNLFYSEKKAELMIEKSLADLYAYHGFSDSACVVWNFNSLCEPDFEKSFVELFKKNSGFTDVKIENKILIIKFKEEVKKEINNVKYTYWKDVEIKKDVDFSKEKEIASKVKACSDNDFEKCLAGTGVSIGKDSSGSITFSMENNKKQLFFENTALEFSVDSSTTAII